jgi:hypothetical protein
MWVPLDRTCEVSPRARPIQVKSDTRRYKTQGLDVVGPAPVAGSCEVEITPRPTRHSYEQPMHALIAVDADQTPRCGHAVLSPRDTRLLMVEAAAFRGNSTTT